MINCEVKVFNKVHGAINSICARFVSTPVLDYTKLPAASLYEMDNAVVRNLQSSTPIENYALITYQFEVVAPTKAKCREIFCAADEEMIALNFDRISGQYVTYPENMKIVRYVARYEAVVDRDGNLYRRG